MRQSGQSLEGAVQPPLTDELMIDVRSAQTLDADPVKGMIFGHDVERNLLVIKIPAEDLAPLGLKKAPIASFSAQSPEEVCVIGIQETAQSFLSYRADKLQPKQDRDIRWKLQYRINSATEIGSAVINARSGDLTGIVIEQEDNLTRYLPIEYADTLLSQIFLARIMKDMESFSQAAKDVQTGVSWSYQITHQNDGKNAEPPRLGIRFFLDPYSQSHDIDYVQVSTKLKGTSRTGEQEQEVPRGSNGPPVEITVRRGATSIDYNAGPYLAVAADQGFTQISTIEIGLIAYFRAPPGEATKRSPKMTFELPVDIKPRLEQ